MSAFRLAEGGRIDRSRRLRFSFDGRRYEGFAGDTLASALIANGRHLVGRSFKYHRPRGIMCAGSDEPNALVNVKRDAARTVPNLRATTVELFEGLTAESQNRFPSLRFDLGAANDLVSPLLPSGFYYKTFMWPASFWKKHYEPRIRAMAGLGRAPTAPDPDRYAARFMHCDVLVVGAGPAGLAAALAAVEAGARVVLCDEQAELGGSLLAPDGAAIEGQPAAVWLAAAVAELASRNRVSLLPRTTAFGYFAHNLIGLAERVTDHLATIDLSRPRERLWQVRAREVVLATGAHERPLVFPGNDHPGVMLAEAARTYVERYAARPGTRAVVAAAHDSAYDAALSLHRAGIEIAAIADLRADPSGEHVEAARAAGLTVRTATAVVGARGRHRVSAARLAPVGEPARSETIACDLLLMAGGFTPSVHLFSQSRGKLRFDDTLRAFLPDAPAERTRCVGACRGVFGLRAALEDGYAAGAAAVARNATRSFSVAAPGPGSGGLLGLVPGVDGAKAFVDFQNDVTAKDLKLATREGFESIEHVKRYTTTGMATDQGKTSNMNALGIVADALGRPVPQVGLTTFRMPYTPVTFGTLAATSRGELFEPVRTTPMHEWAAANGAIFEDVGLWKRARCFPRRGEDMHRAVARECQATRSAAGIFDASTLGKIEVVGPDAATFMNRMYVNDWTKLPPGRCRYGVMLRDDGFVMDDGVVGRLAADRFHVTTTTGGASRVLSVMEDYLQTEWPDLDVWLTSVTEQWVVIAVQGPAARQVLEPLVEGIDITKSALPHMAVREGHICGVPTRLFRVSFTGELGFEINVPAMHGPAVWQAVIDAGTPHGITPYGTEAMHVLRAEKGYIVVGQETDGTATPDDVGLTWAIGKAKNDFVGKRSLARAEMSNPARKQLVGLLTDEPEIVLEEGAQIVADANQPVPMRMFGHVTSSYASATLGRSIALAMVAGGRSRIGETLFVPMPDRAIRVTVVSPVFYDPEGGRLNA
jgi:sarcosine oxidase subunit alpha